MKIIFTANMKLMAFAAIMFFGMNATVYGQSLEELADLSLEELLNLEVTTASKNAEGVYDAAGVIYVVTQNEIERYGGNTLKDILERVPGLNTTEASFSDRHMIASRGDQTRPNSGHILYLVNGRPTREVLDGGTSSEFLSAFPISAIERIEVVRGPGSVLYGSNAFSAVINVITKEAAENNVVASAQAGIGGGYGVNIMGTAKIKDLEILAAGRVFEKTKWNTTYTGNDLIDPSGVATTDFSVIDDSKGALVDLKYKKLRFSSVYNNYVSNQFILSRPDINEWTKITSNLGYSFAISDNWDLDANVTYNYATLLGGSGEIPFVERNSNDLVAEFTNNIKLNDKSNLIVGGLLNYIKGSDELYLESLGINVPIAGMERNSFALYSQIDYWLKDNLKVIGGFQANKVEGIDLAIVPRAGVIWYPIEQLNIKALYGAAFRAPSVSELSLDYTGITGNPNLNPERVETIDFGVNYLGKKAQFGINYFQNNQTDIINLSFTNNGVTYANLGEIKFQGIEMEGKYFTESGFQFIGSMLFQESVSDQDIWNVTPVPNLTGKIGLSYSASNGITASVFNVIEGKPDDKFINDPFNPLPDSYYMLNIYANFDLVELFNMSSSHQLSFFVQGDNMLDNEVWLPVTEGGSLPYSGGRTVYLGVKLGLK